MSRHCPRCWATGKENFLYLDTDRCHRGSMTICNTCHWTGWELDLVDAYDWWELEEEEDEET